MEYIKSKMGILKIIEIIFTCVAFSCITVSKNGFEDDFLEEHKTRYKSMQILNIFGFLVAIFIVVSVSCTQSNQDFLLLLKILNMFLCIIMVFGCFISAIVMSKEATHEYDSVLYKTNHGKWRWYTNNTIAAVVVDFLAAAAFFIDGIMQIREHAREAQATARRRPRTIGEKFLDFFDQKIRTVESWV
ncbi:uncharacterized protein LOC116303983 isoform X2 [Actinia tenebrosa]|nr:uncharacterized protein LOC116303983 isoform X2 [Actinia tenebrosa]XP_031569492.1 uncharacterized protein LOC116303983 isoform X2 [Actinia tenebrosa]